MNVIINYKTKQGEQKAHIQSNITGIIQNNDGLLLVFDTDCLRIERVTSFAIMEGGTHGNNNIS